MMENIKVKTMGVENGVVEIFNDFAVNLEDHQ
jgi:hypothetical protein